MHATVDSAGRVLIPRPLRDSLGIQPGSVVDITEYGAGLAVIPEVPKARLVMNEYGRLVIDCQTVITDEMIYRLRDEGRK